MNRPRWSRRTLARAARAVSRPRATSARIGAILRAGSGDVVGDVVQRLPGDLVGHLKSRLRPVGRLDYAPKRIDMHIDSAWQLFRLGSCAKEPETIRWLESELRPGDTFYDIGANVGAYSLVAFAITAGQAKIVAFEPGFATFTVLCQNIQLNSGLGRHRSAADRPERHRRPGDVPLLRHGPGRRSPQLARGRTG